MAILGISLGTGRKSRGPSKTADQLAAEKRTMVQLDEEIEENEARLKAAARGKLGRSSLLAGQKRRSGRATTTGATGTTGGSAGGAGTSGGGSLLRGGGGRGGSRQ